MNLKHEIVKSLHDCNKALEDIKEVYLVDINNYECEEVIFIGDGKDFNIELCNFEYDNGYGSQVIDGWISFTDNTWLGREEYDGSEWFNYYYCPSLEDLV